MVNVDDARLEAEPVNSKGKRIGRAEQRGEKNSKGRKTDESQASVQGCLFTIIMPSMAEFRTHIGNSHLLLLG